MNLKRNLALALVLAILGCAFTQTASAHGYYRGGSRVVVGVGIGAPYWGWGWGYGYPYGGYYYPPAYAGYYGYPYAYYPRPYYYPPAAQPVPSSSGGVSTSNCRDYSSTQTIDGQPQTVTGTACQQSDGSWRIVR